MIAIFINEDNRVYLIHRKPELLSPSRRVEAALEVEDLPQTPTVEEGFQAYLIIENGSLIWEQEPRTYTKEEKQLLAASLAARLTVVDKIRAEELDDDTIASLTDIFPDWRAGVAVSIGEVYSWDGTLVECVQAHTTQSDWTPDVTPALWKIHRAAGAAPAPWVQPAGAHDAYQIGDKVTYNGFTWESTAANNVWAPGVYGWAQI